MVRSDPYTPNRDAYECVSCGFRTADDERSDHCPDCGGTLRNIAVPRE